MSAFGDVDVCHMGTRGQDCPFVRFRTTQAQNKKKTVFIFMDSHWRKYKLLPVFSDEPFFVVVPRAPSVRLITNVFEFDTSGPTSDDATL